MGNLRTIEHRTLNNGPTTAKLGEALKDAKLVQKHKEKKMPEKPNVNDLKTGHTKRDYQHVSAEMLEQWFELFPDCNHAEAANLFGYSPTIIGTWRRENYIPRVLEAAIKFHILNRTGQLPQSAKPEPQAEAPKKPVLFIMFGDGHGIVDKLVKMSSLMKTLQADLHEKCVTFTGPKEDLDNLRELVKTMMDLECFVVEV